MPLQRPFWVKNEDYWNTKWQLTEEIKTAFDKNSIQIPFPQVDVNIQTGA
jgi:small conductance mechanosensitive channel